MLTAYIYHKTTGAPLTDPTITVYVTLANLTNDSKVLDNVVMTQSSALPGAYFFNYTLDTGINYISYYSCSNSNYIPQVEKEFHRPVYGGQSSSSAYDFNAQDRKNIQDTLEKYQNIEKLLERYFNDTNSHIDIAKNGVIDTIKAIEIPEVKYDEIEAKKLAKYVEKLDKNLSEYIDSERKEKEELGAITREFTRLEMEEAKREKEKEIEHKKIMEKKMKMEEEEDKKIMEQIQKEFDLQEQEDMKEKKKELEKELEEVLSEAEEIKKELNSLK